MCLSLLASPADAALEKCDTLIPATWIRKLVARTAVEFKKAIGIANVFGLLTKEPTTADIDQYVDILGAVYQDGWAELAVRVAIDEVKVTTNTDGELDVMGRDRPGEVLPATHGPVIAKFAARLASGNGVYEEKTEWKAVGHFKVLNNCKDIMFAMGSEMFTLARSEEREDKVEKT